ncbi:hypothetical protein LTR53_011191 [Teratosphaeriaceae sp. CCFEE 6253]|nr:hypothetical protein LTR53_011191 [Teratosphaeriaceae sp. CCFEE 6253]
MPFADATAVHQTDPHTYTTAFHPAWTIGSVPHGGYVTACLHRAVQAHFASTLAAQDQPHLLTLHLDFLRRTQTGPATITITDVKLGRQASVVHVALRQPGRGDAEVVGYATHGNLHTEAGVSFPTSWAFHPSPPPMVDVGALETDTDPLWAERHEWPFASFRKVTKHLRSWFPRAGQAAPAVVDQWLCLRDSEDRFTDSSLGFVADCFPQIMETYLLGYDPYAVDFERSHSTAEQEELMKGKAAMWYPTLVLNLDVKKALPAEGVKFLFLRVQAKSIKNGRFDLEVIVKDAEGDVVALSHHVCLAVGSERNLAARRQVGDGGEAKL